MRKILFLTYRLPNPLLKDGYSIRTLGLAKILKKEYDVDLVSLYQNKEAFQYKRKLQKVFNNLYLFQKNIFFESLGAIKGILTPGPIQEGIYFSPKMQGWIKENYKNLASGENLVSRFAQSKNYDLIFCETLRAVKYVEDLSAPVVVDLIESLSFKYFRAKKFVSSFWKLVYEIEMPRIYRKEKRILEEFKKVFISSPFDKRFLEEKIGHSFNNLIVLPNGVKEELFTNNKQQTTNNGEENFISFFGKMDYQPNEDAAFWFSKEIFPKIQKKMPDLKFYIIGTNPTKKIKKLANKNIKVTDFLKDPYLILKKSKLVVIPLRFGAGIQNKVLETMALGKAVVTSKVGAQGIQEAEPGKHFKIINSLEPEVWAKKIIDLISDARKRESLGRAAKELIEENYRWEKIGRQLLAEIDKVLKAY